MSKRLTFQETLGRIPTDVEQKDYAASGMDKATRRQLRAKFRKEVEENYKGDDPAKAVRDFFLELKELVGEADAATGALSDVAQTGAIFYELMNRFNIVDVKGRPMTKAKFEDGSGLRRGGIRLSNPDLSVFSDQRKVMFNRKGAEKSYQDYLKFLEPEKRENVINTVKKVKNAMKDMAAVERARKRSKLLKIDKSEFTGTINFTKASTREDIYDFWASVAPKYNKVKSTLDKLLAELDDADVFESMLEELNEKKEKFEEGDEAQRIVIQDLENEIEKKKADFKKDLAKLKQQVEGVNLEYLVSINRLKVPFEVSPWKRMLDAVARYENAERVLQFTGNKQKERTGEEQGMRESEITFLAGAGAEIDSDKDLNIQINEALMQAPSSDDQYSGATMMDISIGEKGQEAKDVLEQNEEKRLQKIATESLDPLLAIECVANKRLISLDEESRDVMQALVKELRQGTDLEFISQADKWIDELEESFLLERDVYVLPAAVFQSKKGAELKIKKLPTAEEGANYKLEEPSTKGAVIRNPEFADIIDQTDNTITVIDKDASPQINLNNVFDNIHTLLTSERYSFLLYPRTDTVNRTKTDKGEARGQMRSADSIARKRMLANLVEPMRTIGKVPARKGKLISGVGDSDVGKALAEFILACNEYYFEPFLKGKTPFAYPRFMSGVGIKALTVIADDLGYETMSGNVARKLSGIANVQLTSGQISSLTKFFSLMDEAVVVEEKTIKLAEKAAKVLTKIFKQKEKNLDTVAALLYNFMEQTKEGKEHPLAKRKFTGDDETIRSRALSFGKSEDPLSYPIFSLYLFLEQNQGLLTRNKSIETEYNRLMETLTQVSDDMPEILTKLLKAHNEIRKAMGKRVVRGVYSFNHDGFDKIVDMMYKEENIDLSHLEVENIVKSIDSHSNIGREYGITAEQVYLIKAHIR